MVFKSKVSETTINVYVITMQFHATIRIITLAEMVHVIFGEHNSFRFPTHIFIA